MRYEDYLDLGRRVNEEGELVFQECPHCGDEKWHFYFNGDKGVGHCKKCDYSPNRLRLVRDLGLTDFRAAPVIDSLVESLNDLDDMTEEITEEEAEVMAEEEEAEVEFDHMLIPLPLNAQPAYHYHSALSYLLKRGLSLQQVFDYELHYCKSGKYAGRLIFPVRDTGGSLVGFTTRGIFKWSSKPKYKTPPTFSISGYLYGGDMIKEGCNNLIVVEGPFDKINVGSDCVATFGKQLSRAQLRLILDLTPESISLVYDADTKDSIISTAALLSHYIPVKVVMLPDGEDPASLSKRTVTSLIQRAPYYRSIDWSITVMGMGNDVG